MGPSGTYKGLMVFTFAKDKTSRAVGGNGYMNVWQVIRHAPAPPKALMPPSVRIANVDGNYRFIDSRGDLLYTAKSKDSCAAGCTSLVPFTAPVVGRSIGDWLPAYGNDGAQWTYRGKLVFVRRDNERTPPPGMLPLSP